MYMLLVSKFSSQIPKSVIQYLNEFFQEDLVNNFSHGIYITYTFSHGIYNYQVSLA